MSLSLAGQASYGSRLMPCVVDELSASTPSRVYASVPVSSDLSEGFRDVTFREVAAATNSLARRITAQIGRSETFETIAYIGSADLRYAIFFLAAVKCGYKVLLPSVRNASWMNVSLLGSTTCSTLFYTHELLPKVEELQHEADRLEIHAIPALVALLETEWKPFSFDKTYEAAKWDPILILHSSGSTGPPKPITMYHATFAVNDYDRLLPQLPGRKNQNYSMWDFPSGGRFFSPFPAFHLAGFTSMLPIPIYSETSTLVLAPPNKPPNGQLVSAVMDHFPLKAIFCPPAIAEMLVQEPKGLEQVKNLNFLLYAGGPLSRSTGEALSQVTDVCQFYGQTETGPIQALIPYRGDWDSLEWHPKQEVDMQLYTDEVYELVMHRNPALEKVRALSCNFPEVETWHTKDLFRKHPSKPNLWRFYGRVDDIIVLSNGEKFNPVPSEIAVQNHPSVAGALIVGHGRFQPALLVELRDQPFSRQSLLDNLWTVIEAANGQAQEHGRISRSMILIAGQDKPFDRAAKGTIIRRSTTRKYEREIEDLYAQDKPQTFHNLPHLELPFTTQAIETFVTATIQEILHTASLTASADLFMLGMDSLKTMELANLLRGAFQAVLPSQDWSWISTRLIYSHPTSGGLAETISQRVTLKTLESELSMTAQERSAKIHDMIDCETKSLKKRDVPFEEPTTFGKVILLTGSTGSLGSSILQHLLSNTDVVHVYCLNRSADAENRQAKLTNIAIPDSRITFFQADLSEAGLGLALSDYATLVKNVDTIIHNSWTVNFHQSLDSFKRTHVDGVKNLASLAASSQHAQLVFISSISSVGKWGTVHSKAEPVPEEIATDPAVADHMGYAESKYVAETILHRAARACQIPTSVLRIGQIAGPISPSPIVWNDNEWVPALIKTSKALGKIPDNLPPVNWIPVDILAAVVTDIVSTTIVAKTASCQVFNVVNPSSVSWSSLLPSVEKRLGSTIQRVPLASWISELEKADVADHTKVHELPAAMLLEFFKTLDSEGLQYETGRAATASQTFRAMQPIKASWMESWTKSWGM